MAETATTQTGEEKPQMPPAGSATWYMLLLLAIAIDLLGLLLGIITLLTGGLAAPLETLPDIIGMATLGAWYYFKTGETAVSGRLKKVWQKQKWAWIFEWLPVTGAGPWWTVWVIKNIK